MLKYIQQNLFNKVLCFYLNNHFNNVNVSIFKKRFLKHFNPRKGSYMQGLYAMKAGKKTDPCQRPISECQLVKPNSDYILPYSSQSQLILE